MKKPAEVDLVREALITFLWDSLDKLVAFVAFVYFANYFTTSAFGAAYTVIGISLLMGSVPNAVAIAIQKRVSEDTTDHERFFVFGAALVSGYALLLGGIAIALGSVIDVQFEHLTLAAVVHLVGRPFLFHVERIFDGVGSPGFAAGLEFVDGLLTAVLRFVFILGFGMGSEGILYSAAASGLGVGLVGYLWNFSVPTRLPSMTAFHDVKRFSSWTLISRIGNEVFVNAPVVLTGTLISPTFASYVKSAKNLIEPARIPVKSVITSIFVEISAAVEQDGDFIQPIQNGVDVASVFAIPLAVGALILGNDVMVTIYGAGYAGSGYVLVAVSTAFVFGAFSKVMTSSLNGSNHPNFVAITSASSAIVALPTFTLAILLFGAEAFLIALILCYAFRLVLLSRYVTQKLVSVLAVSWRFVGDQVVAAFCMGMFVIGVRTQMDISSWLGLFLVVALGSAFYGLVLLVISAQGRRIVATIFGKLPS